MAEPAAFDYASTTLLATLNTTFVVNGVEYHCTADGARNGCIKEAVDAPVILGAAEVTPLSSGQAFFTTDNCALGSVRIFNDPRVQLQGKVIYTVGGDGAPAAPALSVFYQVMVFHIIPPAAGDIANSEEIWLYSGAVWEVHASLDAFPPVNRNYYHLATGTPIYDLITGAPNVAQKGVSVISLGNVATASEAANYSSLYDAEVAAFNALPRKMDPPDVAGF